MGPSQFVGMFLSVGLEFGKTFDVDSTRPSSLTLPLVVSSPWPLQRVSWRLGLIKDFGPASSCWQSGVMCQASSAASFTLSCQRSLACYQFPSLRHHCLVAGAPSPRIFVCTLPSTADVSHMFPFYCARTAHPGMLARRSAR